MKKIVPFFITLLTITNFLCTKCNFNNGASTDGTNTNDNDSVLPGKDRVWWYQGLDNSTEVQEFITELKNTKKMKILILEFLILKRLVFTNILVQLFQVILIIILLMKKIYLIQHMMNFG